MSPYLSYSGRGGSNRGRGGRAGRGGRGRGRGGRTTYVRSGSTAGEIYSGGGNFIDRRTVLNKNQWVRKPEKTKGNVSGKDESITSNRKEDEAPERTPTNVRDNSNSTNSSFGANKLYSGTSTGTSKNNDQSTLVIPKYAHAIMKKNGEHQLILSSNTNARSVVAPAQIARTPVLEKHEQSRQTDHQLQTLTRAGKHKLVSLTSANATATAITAKAAAEKRQKKLSANYPPKDYKYNASLRNPQLRISPVGISQLGIKRVKLSTLPSDRIESDEFIVNSNCNQKNSEEMVINPKILSSSSQATISSEKDTEKGSKSKPTEKFTDFAYRETSRIRQRSSVPSHNMHWSKKNNNESLSSNNYNRAEETSLPTANKHGLKKNMGLVRVHPDERTRICPTFLRGVQCQDPYCRKRHDIPKEYAMPVCSFFQRHGQCLRGEDCVFRHVKVNPKAVVCPSFELLGFCGDEQCKMQHVQQVREGSQSRIRRNPNNVYYRNKPSSGGNTTSSRNDY